MVDPKKMKKKKEKQKYNIFQNISYAFGNIWRWDKLYYLAFIPQIPISVILPLAIVYFPKVLIGLIEQKSDDIEILITIGVYCLILMGMGLVNLFCDARIKSTNSVFASGYYQGLIDLKDKTTDYENTENPKIDDMMGNAYDGSWDAERLPKDLNGLLVNLLGVFTYGSIIGSLNPIILLLLIISSIINYLTLTYVNRYTDKNRNKCKHLDRKNEYLYDISPEYERAKDIKLYNMRVWLLELTKLYQDLRMKWHKKIYNKNLMSGIVDGGLRFIRDGVSYAVLISMLLNNEIDVGSFVFYFGAIAGFSGWLSSILIGFSAIVSDNFWINRLRAYYDVEDKFNHGKGISMPTKDEIPYEIEFRNLTYTYPGAVKPVVDNFNFKINKGERLAVVGSNGAGKTTLVKLICGLYYPTSGSVMINGKDAKEYNIDDYYTQFAAVFQEINFASIPISHFVTGDGENIDKAKVQNVLKLAGLDKLVGGLPNGMDTHLMRGFRDGGIDLSGGERQKLMLARALYKNAPVIVLDEPTAALDPIAENELYMKYADLTKGKTSIYISHRLSSTRFCDRIIFIQDGKIAECGSHNELMQENGLYANMFNIQSHYYKDNIDDVKGEVFNDEI
jgi:ABC-type multidrug transport system fused ATPase/permease subunit